MKVETRIENLENYKKYLKFLKLVEDFFIENDYLRLELPVLSPVLIPESSIEVFKTDFLYDGKKENLFLTPSPELFVKRLLVDGVGDCYYLGKSFRNYELQGDLHSIEFNMLEFYKIGVDYMGLADQVLLLLNFLKNNLKRDCKISLDFKEWEKITVLEAFKKYAEFNEDQVLEEEGFLAKAKTKGYAVEGFTYDEVFSQIYTAEIEPNLGRNNRPTMIYNFPVQFASLAKLNSDKKTVQRFEFYINGIELGNCFTELSNPIEQEKRFMEEQKLRAKNNMQKYPSDVSFLESLEKGLPDCSGIAIGIDRLAMVFLGVDTIQDLNLIGIR